ncbi:MAG: family 43 glycosylhydrolase, partial [Bacteroides sp.]|nr:family 43 glycosylhydrolase [Bacteroides sp.]
DIKSVIRETLQVMTPSDGTFREAVEVFDRNGTYYFLWSEDDTRSENYRVRYGTSDSPLGTIHIPENNLILSKDPEQGIYGTGHNSVIQKPGTDEWYIVYHRFTRSDGIHLGDDAGYNRETCIDRMYFNEDGTIRKVIPTS